MPDILALPLPPAEAQALHHRLLQRWPFDLLTDACPGLMDAYSGPMRVYHDLRHLEQLLTEAEAYFDAHHEPARQHGSPRDLLVKAIYIHDLVQDAAADNEAQSMALAVQHLQTHPQWMLLEPLMPEVERLVMATAHLHPPHPMQPLMQVMADVDLAPLGLPPDAFYEMGRRVRAEYPQVPEALYRQGRSLIFEAFLSRGHLYYTPYFRALYETQARANLQHELNRLQQG